MSALDDDIARAKELLEPLQSVAGPITHRKMFGGASFYIDGVIFAIIVQSELMVKADAALGAEIEAEGGARWTYESAKKPEGGKAKTARMPYWSMPPDALDDPDVASDWARRAPDVAKASAR